jgi:hypothetical protein
MKSGVSILRMHSEENLVHAKWREWVATFS